MIEKIKQNYDKILICLGFVYILIGLMFRNFIYSEAPFLEWDEGIYAQIAKEGAELDPRNYDDIPVIDDKELPF